MGQLDLHVLGSIADAVVRFFDWTNGADHDAEAHSAGAVFDALIQADGDPGGVRCPPPWLLGAGSWTSSDQGSWHRQLWRTAEYGAAAAHGAGWCFDLRRDPGYKGVAEDAERVRWHTAFGLNPHGLYAEVRIVASSGDEWPLEVRLHPPTDHPFGGLSATTLRRLHEYGRPRQEVRNLLQAVESYARWPSVVVAAGLSHGHMRDTIIAQLLEWALRVQQFNRGEVPSIAEDAYRWWTDWARRIGRLQDVTPGDLFLIARRTVQPAHPLAHRSYWKQSLRAKRADTGIVVNAARRVGIARSTAYERLKRAGRRASDFAGEEDAVRALVDFLEEQNPRRSIPPESRKIVTALIEAGMNENSARRQERRTRGLPQDIRVRRLRAAVIRARRIEEGAEPAGR